MTEDDGLDVLVDLCGYAGTSIVSEIMASRCRLRRDDDDDNNEERGEVDDRRGTTRRRRFPIHVSYMGFPGSCGSSAIWDYSVFDGVVVPPGDEDGGGGARRHYDGALVYMPHSYFVNSHRSAIGGGLREEGGIIASSSAAMIDEGERRSLRSKYGIRQNAFVYCCHSRPDKIDPSTFRSWMRAIALVRSERASGGGRRRSGDDETTATTTTAGGGDDVDDDDGPSSGAPVLWMLRSGNEMEGNVRSMVRREFGKDVEEDCLVFADVAERGEHLRRLGIADVFLDTPAYNAHTVGCGKLRSFAPLFSSWQFPVDDRTVFRYIDALYMGVPMISLLRKSGDSCDVDVHSGIVSEFADVDSDAGTGPGRRETRSISTEKLASRVGASLLRAVGLDDLVCEDMAQYEGAMARCALDEEWFSTVRRRLLSSKDSSPLFDTGRWVGNLEAAFSKMVELDADCGGYPDIVVADHP
jgi:protein O-GlcNAc transferase